MKKILIVDDEKPIAHALELKLKHEGYRVDVASNGEMALEMLQANKYDLVILDLIMPKMTGFQVLESLQSKKIQVKVLVASNLGQEQDIQKAKNLGAVDYFIKSDTPISKIVENVSNILK